MKAKLKEERDAKRNTLDDRHFYIFQIATDRLGLEKNEVEEASLEGNQVKTQNFSHTVNFFKNIFQKFLDTPINFFVNEKIYKNYF